MNKINKIEICAKPPDHYERKVHCPKYRVRLMDVHADDIEYKAVLAQIGRKVTFDFSVKCPKCKSIVGISCERVSAPVVFRTAHDYQVPVEMVYSDPIPYRVILPDEEVGA